MRASVLMMVVLAAGCVADAEDPGPIVVTPSRELPVVDPMAPDMDVCALAAALPAEDICSLACDPPAMSARMIDDGYDRGQCYQLYCALTDTEHVLVGVCLPP